VSTYNLPFTLTSAGIDAAFNLGAIDLNVTHVQIGSGNKTPNGSEVALVSPQEYAAITGHFEVSADQHRIAAVIPGSASVYNISEIGLWSGVPGDVGSVLVFYWALATGHVTIKSASIDFNFENDMFFGGVVPANITIVADTQFNALAMLVAHEAEDDPHTQYVLKNELTTAGTSPTYTGIVSPALTAYAAGQRFRVKFHASANVAATLNLHSFGAKALKQYSASGSKVDAVIAANQLVDVEYDGTDFVLLDSLPNPHGLQKFTSNGSFTVPSGVTTIYVSGCGGGGGGGGGGRKPTTSEFGGGGGGGGAGQHTIKQQLTVTPGESIAITIGGAGSGGVTNSGASGNIGTSGGNTVVGAYITLTGGTGGTGGGGGVGEAGGSGGAGYPAGSYGTDGTAGTGSSAQGSGNGGSGASSPFGGGGGAPRSTSAGSAGGIVGGNAGGYGGGGGGGSTGTGGTGGNGSAGIVIIEW
jgi:hypothetical protein